MLLQERVLGPTAIPCNESSWAAGHAGRNASREHPSTSKPFHIQLQKRVLGPIANILANPKGQPDMLVESALDLLAALLRPSNAEGVARMHAAASGPTLQLLAKSDDAGILQSACVYWRCVSAVV